MTPAELKNDLDTFVKVANVLTALTPTKIDDSVLNVLVSVLENDQAINFVSFIFNYLSNKLSSKGAVPLDMVAEIKNAVAAAEEAAKN